MNLERYLGFFETTWPAGAPLDGIRFVVLDTETTGLDPRRDRLITIGAVAVQDGEIRLDDSFEALLKLAYNSSSVTIHGITFDEAPGGLEEPEALASFLEYLRDGVIVGHHIGHDIQMLDMACERNFGFTLRNRSLDTMDITLFVEKLGALKGKALPAGFTLDALCEYFGVVPHDRHTAGGDAFITAQILLRLLLAARRVGLVTLEQLATPSPSSH
jgi:DNA polymerase III subunit epsilon